MYLVRERHKIRIFLMSISVVSVNAVDRSNQCGMRIKIVLIVIGISLVIALK